MKVLASDAVDLKWGPWKQTFVMKLDQKVPILKVYRFGVSSLAEGLWHIWSRRNLGSLGFEEHRLGGCLGGMSLKLWLGARVP